MKDFDVIVVGAGLGGLSAATSLSRAGKKVLLLERHNVPGGYAGSFLRGRFEFDASLHELSGVGAGEVKGPAHMLLQDYGVLDKIELVPINEFYRVVLPNVDVTFPADRQGYEEAFCGAFPGEREGISRLTSLVFGIFDEMIRSNMLGGDSPAALDPREFPLITGVLGKSVAEVLAPLFRDNAARAAVSQLCHYLGQPPSRCTFLTFALALSSYLTAGPVHIKGTSQALSQAFVDVIEENGGQVWLNHGAKRITTDAGKITGVVTERGLRLHCRHVVCSANPMVTCLKLIGASDVPDWYLSRLRGWTPGLSTFNLFLGLDRPCGELGLNVHETFVGGDYDLDRQYDRARLDAGADRPGAAVTYYNAADPEFSPPGTSVVVVTVAAYGDAWLKLKPEEYEETKRRVAQSALDLTERVAPGFQNHIEVLEAATPLTNIRYTLNPGGSFTGFAENRYPTTMSQLPGRGPFEGLYFANAWVRIGGGYMPTMLSGMLASAEVLADMEDETGAAAGLKRMRDRLRKEAAGMTASEHPGVLDEEKALGGRHPERISLKVSEILEETGSTRTLRLTSKNGALPVFRPGQYVNVFVSIRGVATCRPYSISSAPGRPYYDLTIRRVEEGFVSSYLLDQVKVGDVLECTGPKGTFCHEPLVDTSDIVCLAGGSGITPFMSLIREATASSAPLNIHVLYGSRVPEDVIFRDELEALATAHANVKVDFIMSETSAGWSGLCGFMDEAVISSLIGSVEGKTFFLCGPAGMHVLCEDALCALGVPGRRIKREAYGPPADIALEPGWPGVDPETEFSGLEERSGTRFTIKAGEPLLNSMERAGLVVPSVCRSGECAVCRTRLTAGSVFIPNRVRRRWVDEKAGYIHPCMSFPLEDVSIRL